MADTATKVENVSARRDQGQQCVLEDGPRVVGKRLAPVALVKPREVVMSGMASFLGHRSAAVTRAGSGG